VGGYGGELPAVVFWWWGRWWVVVGVGSFWIKGGEGRRRLYGWYGEGNEGKRGKVT
jgi:hypothetical protein